MTNFVAMAYAKKQKQKIFDDICDSVVRDKISFNKAIEDSEINLMTFYRWLSKNDTFKKSYNYAREIRADVLFEEIIEIADSTEEGTKVKSTPKGMVIETGDMTDHRRLKIDARKWVVSKMNGKKYGNNAGDEDDKLDNEITVKIV